MIAAVAALFLIASTSTLVALNRSEQPIATTTTPTTLAPAGAVTKDQTTLEPSAPVTEIDDPVVQISTHSSHTCALRKGGSVYCWGSSLYGELGTGTLKDTLDRPTLVNGLPAAISVAAGNSHTCAAVEDGSVYCWGDVDSALVTKWDANPTPTRIEGLSDISTVVAGEGKTCALQRSGTVYCWGLTLMRTTDIVSGNSFEVAEVPGLQSVSEISMGTQNICVKENDELYCWGNNRYGQTGPTAQEEFVEAPTKAPVDANPMSFDAGIFHTCAIKADGTPQCWGSNSNGKLGDGTETSSPTPVDVANVENATKIAVTSGHTCALLQDGRVACWGLNGQGQLGDGTTTTHFQPIEVEGIEDAVDITVGSAQSCAILADGSAQCWGRHQLTASEAGDESTATPVDVVFE